MALRNAAVAAAGQWVDPDDGIRYPAGEVHAWERGRNETVCGLSLSRSRLARFPHVSWADVQPESGRHAEEVQDVCRRCRAALGGRRTTAAGRGPTPGPEGQRRRENTYRNGPGRRTDQRRPRGL
jgi:hypothetical protein